MSKGLVLISPPDFTLKVIADKFFVGYEFLKLTKLETGGPVYLEKEVDTRIAYLSISNLLPTDVVNSEYQDWEEIPEKIKGCIAQSQFHMLTFNDLTMANECIFYLLNGESSETLSRIWFDNDYAKILSGISVLNRLSAEPDWFWQEL